jgi:hypothetical protein
VIRAPREEPGFHVGIADVVSRLHLPSRLPNLRPDALLIGDIGLDRVRDQEIRASPGLPSEFRQAPFDGWFEPNAKCAGCVRHEHFVAQVRAMPKQVS